MDISQLRHGDLVVRSLGGVPMDLAYLGVRGALIYAGLSASLVWTFDVATGAEVDDGLEWGPAYGRTGSRLTGVIRGGASGDVTTVAAVWATICEQLDADAVGSATRGRLIPRWSRAPGYDALLDAADAAVRVCVELGHAHRVEARSKGGIDFAGSACHALRARLDEFEAASDRTCQVCGAPGTARPQHPYQVLCDAHASV